MRITAVYRAYAGDGTKARPRFYSKILALQSFLLALRELPEWALVVLLDSDTMPEGYIELCEAHDAEIHYLGSIGNVASYLRALDLACERPDDELVYLAEDDYLYRASALRDLSDAAEQLTDAGYFTVYDHPDRYRRDDDARLRTRRPVSLAGRRHWRRAESTTMTFAARPNVLRQDRAVHERFCRYAFPEDREIWRAVQGLGRYRLRRATQQLVSVIPAGATHLEEGQLAPGVDWPVVADDVAAAVLSGALDPT